jgi:glycosyltransferase involved in cell wall biosynthesis
MLIGIDASRANRAHRHGPEWYSYYIIKHFARLDKKNQYVLYSDIPLTGGLLDLTCPEMERECVGEIKYDKEGFQVLKSPHNNFRARILSWPFKFLWTQGRLSAAMLSRKCGKPDILFIPAHTLPFIHPRKSVVTVHDVGFERENDFYEEEKIGSKSKSVRGLTDLFVRIFTLGRYGANSRDYQTWSIKFALKRASAIVCPSEFTKSEIISLYDGGKDKIKVVANGLNRDFYNTEVREDKVAMILEKYGVEKPYLFYLGRLERKKNIPSLVEAFGIMKNKYPEIRHKLVLAGNASYGYDEANFMASEYDVSREVIMPGWIEERDLPYFYKGADAFVFPSRYEGFGIPLLQAMGTGIPIATSNRSPIPEIVGDAGYFFDADDVYAMSEALREIIINQDLRKRIVLAGIRQAKNYSWEKCARETLAILEEL